MSRGHGETSAGRLCRLHTEIPEGPRSALPIPIPQGRGLPRGVLYEVGTDSASSSLFLIWRLLTNEPHLLALVTEQD